MERRARPRGRIVVDADAFAEAARRGGPPTSDDVMVTVSGERLDTPDKLRRHIATYLAAHSQQRGSRRADRGR